MALQIRRGTEAERLTITPVAGELIYTTDLKQLFIGDGSTIGGVSISEQAQDALASLVSGQHTGIYFTYDDANNALTATVTGGVDSLNTLTDVSISGPANDEILKYAPGTGWINGTIGIDTLNDVTIVTPTLNESLKWNGTSWVNGQVPLDSLSDVVVSNSVLDQVITWNGTNWVNGSIPVDALSDVTITNPTVGQVLKWNGTNWVNGSDLQGTGLLLDDLADVVTTTPSVGQGLIWSGTNWINGDVQSGLNATLDSLVDVAITTPTIGQILKYSSGGWHNTDDLSITAVQDDLVPALGGNLYIGSFSIFGDGAVNTTGEITALQFNGTLRGQVKGFDNSIVLDSGSKIASLNQVNTSDIELGTTSTSGSFNVYNTTTEFGNFHGITAGGLSTTWLKFNTSRTSHTAPTAVQNGDILSGLLIHGYNGTAQKLTVAFGGQVDGAIGGAGDVPGAFLVLTRSATGTDHYMKFDSAGTLAAETVKATKAIQQPVYADTAARDAAITSPAPGMCVFVTDVGGGVAKFQGYTGAAWVDLN